MRQKIPVLMMRYSFLLMMLISIPACAPDDAPPAPDTCAADPDLCEPTAPTAEQEIAPSNAHNKQADLKLDPWELYEFQFPQNQQTCNGATCWKYAYPTMFTWAWHNANTSGNWKSITKIGVTLGYDGIRNHMNSMPVKCELCAETMSSDRRCTQGVTGYPSWWYSASVLWQVPREALNWFAWAPGQNAYFSLTCWVRTEGKWALPIMNPWTDLGVWYTPF